ncbi:MAG: hypothetical protein LBR66_00980 [Candidatus Symbiothrix sp.]|nr:hypothetical protein [Candidatus Symbiothrix sp.]
MNDICFYPYFPFIKDIASTGEFIATVDVYTLFGSIKKMKAQYLSWDDTTQKRFDEMEKLTQDLNEESNPILFMFTFAE